MNLKQSLISDLEFLWDRELKRMYEAELKNPRRSSLVTSHLAYQDVDKRAAILNWVYQTSLSEYLVSRQKLWKDNKLADLEIRKSAMMRIVTDQLKQVEETMRLQPM